MEDCEAASGEESRGTERYCPSANIKNVIFCNLLKLI